MPLDPGNRRDPAGRGGCVLDERAWDQERLHGRDQAGDADFFERGQALALLGRLQVLRGPVAPRQDACAGEADHVRNRGEEGGGGGRTYMRSKPPLLACPSPNCKKKWNSGGQEWPEAVGSFWTHLQGSSTAEEAEALAGGDRTVMVHPTKEMLGQMEVFWKKQNRRDAELKLQAQGAAPSPRSAEQARRWGKRRGPLSQEAQ